MNTSDRVKTLLDTLNISVAEAARRIGTTRQNLSYKLSTNRLTVQELEDIAEAVGAKLQITFVVPEKQI